MTRAKEKNGLEWVVFGVALLLTLATVAYLVVAAARHQQTPPDLRATLGAAESTEAGVRVPIHLHNRGQTAARTVILEVSVPGIEMTPARLQLDRVPPDAVREGWVLLDVTVEQAARARVDVRGFEAP